MKIVVVSSDYFVIGGLFSFHREISWFLHIFSWLQSKLKGQCLH
jgi:hypothetical protein